MGGHVPEAACTVTGCRAAPRADAWRHGMVRPPVVPLLARLATGIASAICPCASGTIAQVSEARSVARRPASIDHRTYDGERVGSRDPNIARSWVGRTSVAGFPSMRAPRSTQSPYSYAKICYK